MFRFRRDQDTLHGNKWTLTLITSLWEIFDRQWKSRTEAIHSTATYHEATMAIHHLHQRVRNAYEKSDLLTNADRRYFHQPIEELLSFSAYHLRQWLAVTEPLLCTMLNSTDHEI